MNFFSYDGKLMNFLTTLWNIIWINFLWLICSIPVITFGAASTAAYYAMNKSVRNSTGYVTKEFFRSLKDNFKQATLLSILYLLVGVILSADAYYFYYCQADYGLLGRILSLLLILIFFCAMNYSFVFLARFKVKTFLLLKYGFQLTLIHLPQTFAFMVFFIATAIFIYWLPVTLFIVPGLKCYADSMLAEKVVQKYIEQLKDEKNIEV